ncbi:hypothetical protein PF004_g12795 [Phytophthora fragariae]|uniref:Uncharacterized protein n=1 Tax=Phytophthora fragariae TaxID=53985 RepID=A0A6G0NTZ6_9STRA|nr:hypothetical protein PF004_g12795 [Phytophthora fragariae]
MSNTDGILVLVLSGLLPCEEASTSTPLVTALAASFWRADLVRLHQVLRLDEAYTLPTRLTVSA